MSAGSVKDLYTLLAQRTKGNWQLPKLADKQRPNRRCYHHIEVRPQTIGRVLGIGLRVAGRVAGQHLNGSTQAAGTQAVGAPAGPQADIAARGRLAGESAGRVSGSLTRGVAGFLRPFGRVGGILWLEVTGVFFLLPVVVFGPTLWRTRASWAHGPDHRTFLASAIVIVVFLYLSVSSFWRARRK
ncbi:MAG: hypothetical protein WAM85_20350 [Terracidiphilus sp.]